MNPGSRAAVTPLRLEEVTCASVPPGTPEAKRRCVLGDSHPGSLGRSWLPGGLFSFVCFALLFSWFCINQKFVDIKSGVYSDQTFPIPEVIS